MPPPLRIHSRSCTEVGHTNAYDMIRDYVSYIYVSQSNFPTLSYGPIWLYVTTAVTRFNISVNNQCEAVCSCVIFVSNLIHGACLSGDTQTGEEDKLQTGDLALFSTLALKNRGSSR